MIPTNFFVLKVLFITLAAIDNLEERGIYSDLMRCFVNHGHEVNIVSPIERRFNKESYLIKRTGHRILRVKTLNIQKTNIIEKLIGTFLIDFQLKRAINRFLAFEDTELIVYSTPPITLVKTISFLKQATNARTYLLLKDIFPQNAVDMGYMKAGYPFYHYFRRVEKQLYHLSDKIGCMSPANVRYLLEHNNELKKDKVEVCPNSIYPIAAPPSHEEKMEMRIKYGFPTDRRIFIYGGNLGKPQAIDFIIEFLEKQKRNEHAFFIVVGSGTDFPKLARWNEAQKPKNLYLSEFLPKAEYDEILKVADFGLIFLDYRFTIPNFPSRLTAYLETAIPVIAVTDTSSDMGEIIESNKFGYWAKSNDIDSLNYIINKCLDASQLEIQAMGLKGRFFLESEYHVETAFTKIIDCV